MEQSSGEYASMSENRKRSRGSNILKVMATGAKEKQQVEWNSKGQPVGEASVKFSSTMGVIVREQVSIVIKNWREVEASTKESLWILLLQKYNIDKPFKIFIMQQMGKLWRSWKSELSIEIRKVLDSRSTNAERMDKIANLRPRIVSVEEWNQFVQERMSFAWQVKSSKMREIRAKQTFAHTLSRKGYARKEYDYNKENLDKPLTKPQLWIEGHTSTKKTSEANVAIIDKVKKKMEEGTSVNGEDDVLTQVLGKDHPGRIRGLGAGVTKTKLFAQTLRDSKYVELESQLKAMTEKYMIIEGVLASRFGVNISDEVSGKDAPVTSKTKNSSDDSASLEVTTSPKSGKGSVHQPSIHDKCKLMNWNGNGQEVAKGSISAIDPKATVHGVILGHDCYRVAIEEVLEESLGFYRDEPEFANLGDALGSTIAWPIRYIVFDD